MFAAISGYSGLAVAVMVCNLAAAFAILWYARKTHRARAAAASWPPGPRSPATPQQPQVAPEETRQLLLRLRELTVSTAHDLDAHSTRVQTVNEQISALSFAGDGPLRASLVAAAGQMLEANQILQAELAETNAELHDHVQRIEVVVVEASSDTAMCAAKSNRRNRTCCCDGGECLPVELDAVAVRSDVAEAVREQLRNLTGGAPLADRRREPRHEFDCVQRIAPYRDGRVPAADEFREVHCRDLSSGGFSFWLPSPPDYSSLVVALGQNGSLSYLSAEIIHTTAVERGDTSVYLVGCRFTGRLHREETPHAAPVQTTATFGEER